MATFRITSGDPVVATQISENEIDIAIGVSPPPPPPPPSGTVLDLDLTQPGDLSDAAHDVSVSGNVAFNGTNIRFDGGHLFIPDDGSWNFGSDDWRIECTFRLDEVKDTQYLVTQWLEASGSERNFQFKVVSNGRLVGEMRVGSGEAKPKSAIGFIQPNVTYVAALERVGDTFNVEVDGQIIASDSASGAMNNSSRPLVVSGIEAGPVIRPITGEIYNLKIFK